MADDGEGDDEEASEDIRQTLNGGGEGADVDGVKILLNLKCVEAKDGANNDLPKTRLPLLIIFFD